MPRPHIEFIHAQQLPWRPVSFPGPGWQDMQMKVLSEDPQSGACSVLLRLPCGFASTVHSLTAQFEFYVLDGAQQLGKSLYGLDAYACLPAGFHRDWHSQSGAVLLAFFDRTPLWLSPADSLAAWDRDALIERIDTHNTPWTRHDIDPAVQFLNLSHKVLRNVPATGEKTLLLASGAQTHPQNWREKRLRHDCVEEMYLLGGDIVGERGTMYEGAYFWRPPGQWHGPFGSRRGSLSLIRFSAGHHRNLWSEHAYPFDLNPPFAPQLPSESDARLSVPWQPPQF